MYYQRKPGKRLPRVYVYVKRGEHAKALPRALTRELDGKADWEIEDWMRLYAALNALPHRKLSVSLGDLDEKLDAFCKHLAAMDKYKTTVGTYRARLLDVLPFFAETPNANEWYLMTGKLFDYLAVELGLTAHAHRRANMAFKAFHAWLQEQGLVAHRHALMLRNRPLKSRNTPLKFTQTPEDILRWVITQSPDKDLRLIALLGYFFSLRTDEVFGLRRESFLAGTAASGFEASKVMRNAGLYGKLVVHINKMRRQDGSEYDPTELKRGGVVACFDERAAKLIIQQLTDRPKGLLFTGHPGWIAKRWAKFGIPGLTIKDLRRASIYWLGQYSKLPFTALQNHARHSNPSTTALYTRRPEEAFEAELDDLDLDA